MHSRFHSAFARLSTDLQAALHPVMDDVAFSASFTAQHIQTIKQRTQLNDDALALVLLPLAAACAVTPLSAFNVGAIARGNSGHWYFGANMEFAGIPLQQTVHAEQSAITHAWLKNETSLDAITVNYTPCGHCRQFMNELNSGTALRIMLPDRPAATLGDYLPAAFGPHDLAIETRLFDPVDHGYIVTGDPLTQAAIQAANRSHAPYSQAHSGVALEMRSGAHYTGRYVENVAFNPSLPPLQAALIRLNMHGEDCRHIKRAVLVESADARIQQCAMTQITLASLGCHEFSTVSLHKA